MAEVLLTTSVKTYPNLPYQKMKDDILGRGYRLSLVFVGPTRARALNQTYRGKTYVPNVLSFPLDATTGEIYICPTIAKREAKKFSLSPHGYIGYLFIHGCFHLKGHDHGPVMDKLEATAVKKYGLS
jgi:rRNA maturation RNase YbeY